MPVTAGHLEIIPRRHLLSILDLTDNEWVDLKNAIHNAISLVNTVDLEKIYIEKLKYRNTSQCNEKLIEDALETVRAKLKPLAYNHGVNDGIEAGRTIHHLHWHVIPRYHGDMPDPRGGVRHVIPQKGNYKKL